MGHSRPDTTQQYTDEMELDELAEALERAASTRGAQASPDLTTLDSEITAAREDGVEAAGIEPASADAPERASTSLSCALISPAGRFAGDLPTG
jgi:hypothetical protein